MNVQQRIISAASVGLRFALAWIIIAASPEGNSAQGEKQQGRAQQSPAHAAPKPVNALAQHVAPAAYKHDPCEGSEYAGNPERCAELESAHAAVASARWAGRSFWASLIGVAGLIVTLWFNLEAWKQARKGQSEALRALEAAERRTIAAQKMLDLNSNSYLLMLRAYIGVHDVSFVGRPGDLGKLSVKVEFRNGGQTPGLSVKTHVKVTAFDAAMPRDLVPPFLEFNEGHSSSAKLPGAISSNVCTIDVSKDFYVLLEQGKYEIWVRGLCEYTDTLGNSRKTTFKYICNENTLSSGVIFAISADGNTLT